MLESYIGVKGIEANVDKGNLSYSLVYAIGGNSLKDKLIIKVGL